MIRELTLLDFKSFTAIPPTAAQAASPLSPKPKGVLVKLGGLTLIIGTNASGKSNIRDALRFIHGISRSYTLVEIMGERYGPGGEAQWQGIRGGIAEAVVRDGNRSQTQFSIAVETDVLVNGKAATSRYEITVDVGDKTRGPLVASETLKLSTERGVTFYTENPEGPEQIRVRYRKRGSRKWLGPSKPIRSDKPAVSQLAEHPDCPEDVRADCRSFLESISSVRFLDLEPRALRKPSFRGQKTLGEKGENLSSVLCAICEEAPAKAALIEWVRELTPLDVTDLEFPDVDQAGRIQLRLVENGGRALSAESASDGTLRFLAFAAALLGPDPAQCYFVEELENGIHPNRAYLLLELMRSRTRPGGVQVIATTHSPALLDFLNEEDFANALLVYRAEKSSRVRRFADLQWLKEVREKANASQLHSTGWFENVAAILATEEGQ